MYLNIEVFVKEEWESHIVYNKDNKSNEQLLEMINRDKGLEYRITPIDLSVLNYRWVSVYEKLPEMGIYNVFVDGKEQGFGSLDGNKEWYHVQQSDEHPNHDCAFSDYGQTVTHWLKMTINWG